MSSENDTGFVWIMLQKPVTLSLDRLLSALQFCFHLLLRNFRTQGLVKVTKKGSQNIILPRLKWHKGLIIFYTASSGGACRIFCAPHLTQSNLKDMLLFCMIIWAPRLNFHRLHSANQSRKNKYFTHQFSVPSVLAFLICFTWSCSPYLQCCLSCLPDQNSQFLQRVSAPFYLVLERLYEIKGCAVRILCRKPENWPQFQELIYHSCGWNFTKSKISYNKYRHTYKKSLLWYLNRAPRQIYQSETEK